MTRRALVTAFLLAGMALGSASHAFGQGKGQGNGQGNGAGTGQGNGNGQGNGQGNNQGQGAGSKSKGTKASQAVALDDTASVAAVKAGRAVPLEQVLAAARTRLRGKVINIRLLNWRGTLVYEVKGLSPAGVVDNQYFNAKSGRPIAN